MRMRGLIAILLLLVPSVCCAEVVAIDVDVQSCYGQQCNLLNGYGSGVIIGELKDGRAAVLTAGHVLRDVVSARVRWYDGQHLAAEVVSVRCDSLIDLGLLAVRVPGAWSANEVSERIPSAAASVIVTGYPSPPSRSLELRGTLSGNSVLRVTVRSGMSGGPVLCNGKVVGIVSGIYRRGVPDTNITTGPVIGEWLREVLGYVPVDPRRAKPTPKPAVKPNPKLMVPHPPEELPEQVQPPRIVAEPIGNTATEILKAERPKFVPIAVASLPLPPPPSVEVAAPVIPRVPATQPASSGIIATAGKVADVAATAWTIAQWGGLIGATGGTAGIIMGVIGVARWIGGWRRASARSPPVTTPVQTRPATPAPQPTPITIENPPLPQAIITETRFAPYERDTFNESYSYAVKEYTRIYPGSVATIEAVNALMDQYLTSKGIKPPKR